MRGGLLLPHDPAANSGNQEDELTLLSGSDRVRVPYQTPAQGTSVIGDAIRVRRGARGLTPLDQTLLNAPEIAVSRLEGPMSSG